MTLSSVFVVANSLRLQRYPLRAASQDRHGKQNMHGYTHDKDSYLRRLRRIEGQVRGLQRMIDEDKYCIDILTQVAAATKALQAVALGLLEEHLAHCVAQAMAEGGDAADREGQGSLGGDRPPRPVLNRDPQQRNTERIR